MAKARRSWREKLADSKGLPKQIVLTGKAAVKWGEGVMVVPAPKDVDAVMRQVPPKRLDTGAELREALAQKARVDSACPITTGIFSWIAAHAAQEAEDEGAKKITPWWRTLKSGGELNPKFPGGPALQKKRLEAEGHRIVTKGKRLFVADYEAAVWTPRGRVADRGRARGAGRKRPG
ncbi:MAG TPA: methylated DNA-protein cysteine methyltransferase [Caulifigura sp.]|nr:methylated DNA-protein cysteine methyltransferase [Caulifigura sp.]